MNKERKKTILGLALLEHMETKKKQLKSFPKLTKNCIKTHGKVSFFRGL